MNNWNNMEKAMADIANSLKLELPYKITGELMTIKLSNVHLMKAWIKDEATSLNRSYTDNIYYEVINGTTGNSIEGGRIPLGDCRIELGEKDDGYFMTNEKATVHSLGNADLNNIIPGVIKTLDTIINFFSDQQSNKTTK